MVFNGNLLFQGAPYFQVPCKLSGGASDPQSLPKFSQDLGGATTLILKLTRKLSFFGEKGLFFCWLELVVSVEDCCCGGGGGGRTKINVGGRTQSDK